MAAPVFDGSGSGRGTSVASLSYNVTTSGSNRVLLVQVEQNNASDLVTGVTYNGVAMTQLYAANLSGFMWAYVYALYAPASGTHAVAISLSGTAGFMASVAQSYNSAAQSGSFLNITNAGASSGITSIANTIVTLYTNSFVVGFAGIGSGANPSAGSGTVRRVLNATDGNAGFDSNGAIATPTNYTLNISWTGSSGAYMQALEVVGVGESIPVVNDAFQMGANF